MWLIHQTTLNNLKRILQDGYLRPSSETSSVRLGEGDAKDGVYMTVLFENMSIVGMGEPIEILIIFPISILQTYSASHWTPYAAFGEFTEDSISYDSSKSPSANVKQWSKIYHALHSRKKDYVYDVRSNEVLFPKAIPMEEVACIYAKTNKITIPKQIRTKQALNAFLRK